MNCTHTLSKGQLGICQSCQTELDRVDKGIRDQGIRGQGMSQHTPGPWKITSEWSHVGLGTVTSIKGPDGYDIADMAGQDELAEANARLIAAAPEMLAALQWAMPRVDPIGDRATWETVKALLAKIEKG